MDLPQKTLQIINWEIMDVTIQIVIASDGTITVNGSPVTLAPSNNDSQMNKGAE